MSPTSCQTAPPRARGSTTKKTSRRNAVAERGNYRKLGGCASTRVCKSGRETRSDFSRTWKIYSGRMSEFQVLQTVALASLLAWASGLRLYLVIFVVGLSASFGYVHLPDGLKVLSHPYVIGAAGFLVVLEFLADKFPGLDTAWDGLHTFIRIPAGALLAAGATGDTFIGADGRRRAAGRHDHRWNPLHQGGQPRGDQHVARSRPPTGPHRSPRTPSCWAASGSPSPTRGCSWRSWSLFLVIAAWLLPKLWRFVKRMWIALSLPRDPEGAAARLARRGAAPAAPAPAFRCRRARARRPPAARARCASP